MTIPLTDFLSQVFSNPMLAVTVALTLGVIMVNGWTDAPNAIATCVSTRSMRAPNAIIMAAVFNFLGVLVMTLINSKVAMTIYNMVDFGGNTHEATVALCAALFAIVVWATAAWAFGIPTSESHALIAGLSGAAIALHSSLDGINFSEWVKVLYGLALSTVLGFGTGFAATRLTERCCRNLNRRKTTAFFKKAQIAGGAGMAFMHGAQDGQKFMGVFLLGIFLVNGQTATEFSVPMWLMVLCSVVMALGTSIGGYRIIKSVGMDMVKLQPYLIWLDFNGLGLCAQELEDLIVHKAKLWLDSGRIFGKCGRGFQRINVACPRSTLKEALERIAKVPPADTIKAAS